MTWLWHVCRTSVHFHFLLRNNISKIIMIFSLAFSPLLHMTTNTKTFTRIGFLGGIGWLRLLSRDMFKLLLCTCFAFSYSPVYTHLGMLCLKEEKNFIYFRKQWETTQKNHVVKYTWGNMLLLSLQRLYATLCALFFCFESWNACGLNCGALLCLFCTTILKHEHQHVFQIFLVPPQF